MLVDQTDCAPQYVDKFIEGYLRQTGMSAAKK
jgi:hypothetical protein